MIWLATPSRCVARSTRSSHPRAAQDIELARIDRTLRTLSLAERRNHALVGRALGCGALLIGTVTEYRQRYLGLYSDVAVGAQIELIIAADGARLWEARHVAISRGGGLPISPLAVIEGAVSAVTNLAGEQFDRITDDLARRLVSTLPAPALTWSEGLADARRRCERCARERYRGPAGPGRCRMPVA